jgi:hypothetical protein
MNNERRRRIASAAFSAIPEACAQLFATVTFPLLSIDMSAFTKPTL